MRPSKIMQAAKQSIYTQEEMSLPNQRSAWVLFQDELIRTNPTTGISLVKWENN